MLNLQKLFVDVFDPKKGENVIILNDFPSLEEDINIDFIQRRDMVHAWHKAWQELANKIGFTVEPIIFYEPTQGDGVPFPNAAKQNGKKIDLDKKLKSLGKKDIVLAMTRFSATGPLESRILKQKFRCASMPGVEINMSALDADYTIVAKKAKVLAKKLTDAEGALITFSTGHEVYFDLQKRTAFIDDGDCKSPGKAINFPSGEAFIALYDEKGSKTHGFIPVYAKGHLLIYEIKDNKIIDVISDSPAAKEMQKYFSEDRARANIAELGLGCNDKATYIDNVLQDEKIEGMHWAYGYNDYMGGSIGIKNFSDPKEAIHVDIVYTKEAKIKIKQIKFFYKNEKQEVIMENSRYSFNIQKEFEKA